MNKIIVMLVLLACATTVTNAQQGFGTNTPAASAVVDMTATNKGVLLPRVALTGTTDATTVPSPATNLLVFNTATAGNVTPGFYYWNGSAWVRRLSKGDTTGAAWNLTGNAGTTAGTNFVGTTDAQDLAFKTNATERMRVTSGGKVGIGTATPATSALVDVSATTQGFLPPRLTETQMAAITNPVEGLIVYNTTKQCLAYYAKGAFTCAFTSPVHPPVATNVTENGLMRVGDALTVLYTYTQAESIAEGATSYKWYYATTSDGTGQTALSGATLSTYTVASPAVAGMYVAVGVTPVTTSGIVGSETLSPWRLVVTNAPPMVTSLTVTGCTTVGGVLTATVVITDPDGDALGTPTYKWYYATDATGTGATALSGATAATYTVASPAVVGTYVRVGVIPVATAGTTPGTETFSTWKAITTNAAPYFSSVSNTVCLTQVNWTVSVNTVYADCEGNTAGTPLYQWYRYSDAYGNGKTAIVGATAATYTLAAADLNKYIQAGVTPVSTTGTLMGAEQFASTYLGPITVNSSGSTSSMTITHTAGTVAPVTKTVTYGMVMTSITGSPKCWITQNLGADHQATSPTDATEASAGWYWQFNRAQGYKHDGTTRTPATTWDTSNDNTSTTWQSTKDPCTLLLGLGWRIPTSTEWTTADTWNNYNNTFASVLKIHTSGGINGSGTLTFRSSSGYYWSSIQSSTSNAYYLDLSAGSAYVNSLPKACGFTLRCLHD